MRGISWLAENWSAFKKDSAAGVIKLVLRIAVEVSYTIVPDLNDVQQHEDNGAKEV